MKSSNVTPKTVLVIGASGIIGGAHVTRLAGVERTKVLALSRNPPPVKAHNVQPLAIDLTAPDIEESIALAPVTHAVYAGFVDAPGRQKQHDPNVTLFESALDLMTHHCPALRHVTLLQGMKAYGSHLGAFKTPARESDPRPVAGHFYFDQQDALAARAAPHGWHWTALRPHVVIGPARRSPQNLIAVIGVYASLMKAQGLPLSFPGPEAAFNIVYQATDAHLLSHAIDWAGETESARDNAYNITNGDYFRWCHVWPRIAEAFDMVPAGPQPRSLGKAMAESDGIWADLVKQHSLESNRLEELVSWSFADYIFGTTWDVMAHTGKCRDAGFMKFVDSEQMLLDRLRELRMLKIIP